MKGHNNKNKNSLLQITKALDFRSTKRITVRVALGKSSSTMKELEEEERRREGESQRGYRGRGGDECTVSERCAAACLSLHTNCQHECVSRRAACVSLCLP